MVILTDKVFDLAYSPLMLDFEPSSTNLRDTNRRLNRVATLDGGVVLDDAGYSDGDRSVTITIYAPTQAEQAALQGMIEGGGTQRLATHDGVFEGGIERLTQYAGSSIGIDFLVSSKISE